MKWFSFITTSLAVGLLTAAPANAQEGRWSVSYTLGADIPVNGDLHGGAMGTVLTLPTMVEARDYNEIYGTPFNWSLGLGYMATGNGEFRVQVFRTAGEATELQVGNVATLPLLAQFDDYEALGFDAGWRQFYGSAASQVRPFAGASAGVLTVKEINGTFSVPEAAVVLPDVPMFGDSTVLTFAISGGVLVNVSDNVGLIGEADFRWQGDLDPVDGLAGTGLESINDESRRWSVPVRFGLRFSF